MRFDDWNNDELYHHGIKDQKWGIRRFQNEDGSLTPAGQKRYYNDDGKLSKYGRYALKKEYRKLQRLKDRTDVNLQAQKAQKYDKRASISKKVGLVSAGIAGAGLGGSELLRRYSNKLFKTQSNALIDLDKKRYADIDANWRSLLKTNGHDDAYNYAMDAIDKADRQFNSEYASIKNAAAKRKAIGDAANIVGKVAAGVAVASAGYYAYNKIQSHLSKQRMTDIGHSKAVSKYEAQVQRMKNEFGNIKLSDIAKELDKRK